MEELGTAVTSANALHKGDQGAHTPSSEIASHGHLHQGPPISLHPEQLLLARAACRLASHPGISHPPSQLHKRCRWRRIRVAGYAPVGRTAANLHGASLLRAEGDFSPFSNYFPSHVDPRPPFPVYPRAPWGSSFSPTCSPASAVPLGLPPPQHGVLAGEHPAAHTAWPEHFPSHCQSIIESIRGRRKQRGTQCSLLPGLPLGFS